MQTGIFNLDNLKREYIKLIIPMMMSQLVSIIYGLVDGFFIAQTNNESIVAGVSLCYPMFFILMALGNVFAQGGSSFISRMFGENNYNAAERVSSFCFYATLICGVILGALFLIFRTPMLYMMGASSDTFAHASDYYTIMAFGAPLAALSFIHSNIIRCEGMAKRAMIGSVMGSVVNMILDPIFIMGLGMNAAGAALATVIGYATTVGYLAIVVVLKCKYININPRKCRIRKVELGQVMPVGIIAAILNLVETTSNIVLNQFLLPYGTGKIAAMGIALRVGRIPQIALLGMTFGGIPIFGYLYGQKNYVKLSWLVRYCIRLLVIVSLACSAVIIIAAPWIIPLFMDTGTVVADGVEMLRWQMLGTVFASIVLLMNILFQSMGNARLSFLLSISRRGVIYIAALFIGSAVFGYLGIISAQFVADLISCIIALILFWKTPCLHVKQQPPDQGEKPSDEKRISAAP